MNILILLDAAPGYHNLLVRIGRALSREGHTPCYALDTPLNNHRFKECRAEGNQRCFSEFRAGFKGTGIPETFSWQAFFPDFDRFENYAINHRRRQDWYVQIAGALDAFFDSCVRDWKIDAVLYEGVTNGFAYFASRVARRHGIAYVGLQASRLPGRHELHGDSEDTMRQKVRKNFEALCSGETALSPDQSEWVEDYLAAFDEAVPDYMTGNGLLLEDPITRYSKKEHLRTLWRLTTYQLKGNHIERDCYRSGPPLTHSLIHIRRSVMRWARAKRLNSFFTPPANGDRFYLYPLHYHPEASTSRNARWYVDEYPVIKNLAFSLPPGAWLYVKDHLSAVGYPPIDFYSKVAALPNVKLIHPAAHTKQLIRSSQGVITLTSTVGYEALVLGKPVWILGSVFYDFHPGCTRIGWDEALPALLSQPDANAHSEIEARNLAAAYFLSTLPGALPMKGETPNTASFDQLAAEIVDCIAACDPIRLQDSMVS